VSPVASLVYQPLYRGYESLVDVRRALNVLRERSVVFPANSLLVPCLFRLPYKLAISWVAQIAMSVARTRGKLQRKHKMWFAKNWEELFEVMFVTAIREDCRRGKFEEETCRREKPVETSYTPRILEGFLFSFLPFLLLLSLRSRLFVTASRLLWKFSFLLFVNHFVILLQLPRVTCNRHCVSSEIVSALDSPCE